MAHLTSALRIRRADIAVTALVAAAVELNVVVATGPNQVRLDALAVVLGVVMALPVLLRNRWPFGVLIACSILLLIFYSVHRRDISPVPLLAFPVYDAAVAGYLAWAIAIPAGYLSIGFVLGLVTTKLGVAAQASSYLPSVVLLALAIALAENVRSRRALAAETAERLRLAEDERAAEAGRAVAEERLRIARELHDTVAHAMATIAVQAGAALHRIDAASINTGPATATIRDALVVIRQTSKSALADTRLTLGALRRREDDAEGTHAPLASLDRLDTLIAAARAAGTPVTVRVEGDRLALPPDVDHAAYRIVQESLTNVLKHAGPQATASVLLRYAPDAITIQVTNDGPGGRQAVGKDALPSGGNGLVGMAERAAKVGGEVTAAPRQDGGFEVIARLPLAADR